MGASDEMRKSNNQGLAAEHSYTKLLAFRGVYLNLAADSAEDKTWGQ